METKIRSRRCYGSRGAFRLNISTFPSPSSHTGSPVTKQIRSTDVNFIASQALARSQQQRDRIASGVALENGEEETADAMAALERQARAPLGFVAASSGPDGSKRIEPMVEAPAVANPDAIDVDDDI